jgi:hypothetical protein
VHGTIFAGEKTMSDVLERIYNARNTVIRQNRMKRLSADLTAVYLGRNEEHALLTHPNDRGAITVSVLSADNRTRVFNIPVFVVDADDHLQVV